MLNKSFKKFLPFAVLFSSQITFAYGAHEHGSAKIDIGVDNTTALIHLEVPAISIYGFEHEAKNEKDKKIVNSAIEKTKANFYRMVKFDSSLGCTFSPNKIEPFVKDDDSDETEVKSDANKGTNKKLEGEHGNFKAEFTVKCNKKIAGTKVKFDFKKYFPNISKINAQGLSDISQASAKISNDKGFLQL